MSRRKAKGRVCGARSDFMSCLRHFLTPEVFRQAQDAAGHPARSDTRWLLRPLILVLLLLNWSAGDTLEERFEAARTFYVCRVAPKRRRPGQTPEGFALALARLPFFVLRLFASALRVRIAQVFSDVWRVDGFVPIGCDGTRVACPRTEQLEKRLAHDESSDTPPQVWVTAMVHLRLGLLWSWALGKSDANERRHLHQLLPTLPADALVITDAGYQGYELAAEMSSRDVSFLMRVSSQTVLYSIGLPEVATWSDGVVYWWTKEAQRRGLPPLELRLMRVSSSSGKSNVWMVSNVLDKARLPLAAAGRFYKMRWENEGFFRTYKRTMKQVKLSSRSVKMIHREVQGSLLAVQLLLAMGAWAVAKVARSKSAQSSPRMVLRLIRAEMQAGAKRGKQGFASRMSRAQRDQKPRKSNKVRRPWPKRKPHTPPKPPELLQASPDFKLLIEQHLGHTITPEC
jgi:Transposase DDE domain